jgi:hypothetical protein
MTNNEFIQIESALKATIDERVKGRDIEKLFDTFVENVTDTIIDELPHPGDDDVAMTIMDYIFEAAMRQFHYHFSLDD